MNKDSLQPKVAVVLSNYNSYELLSKALSSILRIDYANMIIIVVENGATDDSLHNLKRNHSDIIIIESKKNLIYTEAYNWGFRKAIEEGAEYITLAHADSHSYSTNYFTEIVSEFQQDTKIFLVGTTVFNSVGDIEFSGGDDKKFGIYMNIPTMGYCFSRTAFEKVGFLDEKLGAYFEDLDYVYRIREIGYRTKFIESVSYVHIGSGNVRSANFHYHYLRIRNIFWFIKKLNKGSSPLSLRIKLKMIFGLGYKTHSENLISAVKNGMFQNVPIIIYAMLKGTFFGFFLPYPKEKKINNYFGKDKRSW